MFLKKNSSMWCSPRFIVNLVSGFWLSKQGWVWVPSTGMGLNSNQILDDFFSHKLYATVASAYLICRLPSSS